MIKLSVFSILFFSFIACASAKVSVFYPDSGQERDFNSLLHELPSNGNVILGEFHSDPSIQKMEARIINETIAAHGMQGQVTVGWEFLNHTEQEKIQLFSKKVSEGKISSKEFLDEFFKNDHSPYLPLVETLVHSQVKLIGLNIPRSYKQQLIKDGIQSLPSEVVPPNMSLGSGFYLERFIYAMGGHVPPNMLPRYFEAQCLTDSSMSYTFSQERENNLKFLVAGSFHTDYFMGTTASLQKLISTPIYLVKIVNKKNLGPNQLKEMKEIHPEYGAIADAIVIMD